MNEELSQETTQTTTENGLKRKQKLTGVVKRLELYGAIIDAGVGIPALLHISQLGKENVKRVADVLKVGDEVTVWVDRVDPQKNQLTVTMVQQLAVEWGDLQSGQTYGGTVTRLENFGAFIQIGAEREGLVHISELSHSYVRHPSEVLQVGDEIQVQVLGFSKRKRRIDLSVKALLAKPEPKVEVPVVVEPEPAEPEFEAEGDEDEPMLTAMEIAMRQAMGDKSGKTRRPQKKQRDSRHRQRSRDYQEDILTRTLRMDHNAK